ncbi:hypothetical protein M087_2454 [Bacteroides fragilis str. S23 R14]|nr:hypothetical protein M087_2454 [Bacteroides fragilis str. S23 R14]EYA63978.1 hypothetical protein M139_4755 [Bacteroides fragilis str. S23L24]EYE44154.1 hypothetical protein M138_2516 [Bacteroides fragilis str. S23L17]
MIHIDLCYRKEFYSFCSINETARQKVGGFSMKMNFVTI